MKKETSKISFIIFVAAFALILGVWIKPASSVPGADQGSAHSRHQCTLTVTDTFLNNFVENLDQDDVSLLAPFFSEDVVSEFGGDFPPETHIGLEATLAEFDSFNQFTDNLQHEILSATVSRKGWQISTTIETSINFDIPSAGVQFVGQQNISLRFNEHCLIDSFFAESFGQFLPIE